MHGVVRFDLADAIGESLLPERQAYIHAGKLTSNR